MAKKTHDTDTIIDSAFALAGESGWRRLTLSAVAERAGLTLADVAAHFATKAELLEAYARRIDQRMLQGGGEPGETARDRLFDVVMRRFEAMAPDRKALQVILRETGGDPAALICGGRAFLRSMALTLECAGLAASGLSGLARLEGLSLLYLYTLRAFLQDDSPDLTRTMAALDKALRRAEGLAAFLWRRPGPVPVEKQAA